MGAQILYASFAIPEYFVNPCLRILLAWTKGRYLCAGGKGFCTCNHLTASPLVQPSPFIIWVYELSYPFQNGVLLVPYAHITGTQPLMITNPSHLLGIKGLSDSHLRFWKDIIVVSKQTNFFLASPIL